MIEPLSPLYAIAGGFLIGTAAALLLLLAGVMGYRRAASRNAADCADKPKPQKAKPASKKAMKKPAASAKRR